MGMVTAGWHHQLQPALLCFRALPLLLLVDAALELQLRHVPLPVLWGHLGELGRPAWAPLALWPPFLASASAAALNQQSAVLLLQRGLAELPTPLLWQPA